MSDSKPVSMPSHLWEALELMSSEMGVPSDALVAQAVFTLARLNGYVLPGKALEGAGAAPRAAAPSRAVAAVAAVASVGSTAAVPVRAQPPGMKSRQPAPEPEPEPE
ncbi:MAG: FHA domain-containing protein, partial [Myxococcota bacterium]